MPTWTNDELDRISTAEELQIASHRQDGKLRNPVTIWVVRVDDDLYVRSYRGRQGAWYRAAQRSQAVVFRPAALRKTSPLWRKPILTLMIGLTPPIAGNTVVIPSTLPP